MTDVITLVEQLIGRGGNEELVNTVSYLTTQSSRQSNDSFSVYNYYIYILSHILDIGAGNSVSF